MRWSKRIIGPGVFGGRFGVPMAAHAASDGSLHLIIRKADNNLRELWWTDTTSGAGDLTGHGAPPAVPGVEFGSLLGAVASYVTRADGRQHVVYVTKDRELWELSWLGNEPAQGGNLLAQTLAPHPGTSLSAYVAHDGSQHVIYLDQSRRVIELQWSGNAVPVPQVAGGDAAHKFPADNLPICSHVYPHDGNSQHAFYLSGGEIIELRKEAMGGDWQARNLTRISSGAPPLAVSGPASLVAGDGTQHVFFVAATGEIFELWWHGNDVPQAENVTVQAGANPVEVFRNGFGGTTTAPPVATHYVPSEGTQHVFYTDKGTNPWEIWWSGPGPKTPENLEKLTGSGNADIVSSAHSLVAADGSQHVIILSPDDEAFVDLVARP
jgi:hypothetical protein